MRKVLRQEHKYQLSWLEYRKMCGRLQLILQPDPHSGPDGYMVRTLYFDTPADNDFYDKREGLEKRQKIRLRIYDFSQPFAQLEMKQKQGPYQLKRAISLSREDAEALIRADFSVLLRYKEDFAGECFAFMSQHFYRPKAILQYRRFAFVAGGNNTRITFDHSITATESSFELFRPHLPMYPVCDPSQATLEVKYKDFLLQTIKDAVNLCNKNNLSLSKYAMARSATLGF